VSIEEVSIEADPIAEPVVAEREPESEPETVEAVAEVEDAADVDLTREAEEPALDGAVDTEDEVSAKVPFYKRAK